MPGDFFSDNLPYVLERVEGNSWRVFNRKYKPLGVNDALFERDSVDLPNTSRYKGLTAKFIEELVDDAKNIKFDKQGLITSFFLYDDSTKPSSKSARSFEKYFEKLKQLSKLNNR